MRIQFKYKNHRGLIEDRDVDITAIGFDFLNHAEFGYQPGWCMSGWDHSRGREGHEFRTFYLSNVILPVGINERMRFFKLITLTAETVKPMGADVPLRATGEVIGKGGGGGVGEVDPGVAVVGRGEQVLQRPGGGGASLDVAMRQASDAAKALDPERVIGVDEGPFTPPAPPLSHYTFSLLKNAFPIGNNGKILGARMHGEIYNDVKNRFADGEEVSTSVVIKVHTNGLVETKSGNFYRPDYADPTIARQHMIEAQQGL